MGWPLELTLARVIPVSKTTPHIIELLYLVTYVICSLTTFDFSVALQNKSSLVRHVLRSLDDTRLDTDRQTDTHTHAHIR